MTTERHGMIALLAIVLGLLIVWASWLHVEDAVLHPRTSRFAYDVEAP